MKLFFSQIEHSTDRDDKKGVKKAAAIIVEKAFYVYLCNAKLNAAELAQLVEQRIRNA